MRSAARSWTAPVLWRFWKPCACTSGRGLPRSKTLPRSPPPPRALRDLHRGWSGSTAIELSIAAEIHRLLPLPVRHQRGEGWGEGFQSWAINPPLSAHLLPTLHTEDWRFRYASEHGKLPPFFACIGSMNPPLTHPRRGTDTTQPNACYPPGRGQGWVGEHGEQIFRLRNSAVRCQRRRCLHTTRKPGRWNDPSAIMEIRPAWP